MLRVLGESGSIWTSSQDQAYMPKSQTAPDLKQGISGVVKHSADNPRRTRRNSLQKIIQNVGLTGLTKPDRTEELEKELRRLRIHSEEVIKKNWADIERIEQDKKDILTRNQNLEQEIHDLREMLQKERAMRHFEQDQKDILSKNQKIEREIHNADSSLKSNFYDSLINKPKVMSGTKYEDLNLKNHLTSALDISSKPLIQRIHRVSLDLKRTNFFQKDESILFNERQYQNKIAEMEFESNLLVSEYQNQLKERDMKIMVLEKTIDLQQENINALKEKNVENSEILPNIKENKKQQDIEMLKSHIVSLENSLENNHNEMKENTNHLLKEINEKEDEMLSLLSIATKQKQFIKLLTKEIKLLKGKEKSFNKNGTPKKCMYRYPLSA